MTIAPVLVGTYEVLLIAPIIMRQQRIVSSGESFLSTMTQEAKSELLIDELNSLTVTNSIMQPFLEMEKLFQVFITSHAASIAGNLTLDGGGIQIQFLLLRQMALWSQLQNTNVTLTNGAEMCFASLW
jgi:hypothetical protein